MISVRAAPPEHFSWIASRAQIVITPAFRALEAVDEGGRILGMVGFDGDTPASICMHQAIDVPIALRRLLRPAFGVVFDPPPRGYGKLTAVGLVISSNTGALAMDLHVGFRQVGRITNGWAPGVDTIILEMRREECRYIDHSLHEREAA